MLHGLLRLPLYLPAATAVAVSLSGTAAGSSSATAQVTVAHSLGGAVAGSSTASGAVTVAHALGGTASGASSAAAEIVVTHTLAATAAGTSSAAGSVTVSAGLSGTASGTSTATGEIAAVPRHLVGVCTGTSSAVATLGVAHHLAAVAAGTSSATGTLTGPAPTARDVAWAVPLADSAPAITAPTDSAPGVTVGSADSAPGITAPLSLFEVPLTMPLAPAIFLDNDLPVRVGPVTRRSFTDYLEELASGLTDVQVYISLTDGITAAPIHEDLLITLTEIPGEIEGTAIYVGGWQGDVLTEHLTQYDGEVVYVILRIGDGDFRAVGEVIVRAVRPL